MHDLLFNQARTGRVGDSFQKSFDEILDLWVFLGPHGNDNLVHHILVMGNHGSIHGSFIPQLGVFGFVKEDGQTGVQSEFMINSHE